VVAEWNQTLTNRLLSAAIRRLETLGAAEITVFRVAGALELPVGANALVLHGCDAVVVIGAIIKGETDHYDIVVRESAAGIARVGLDSGTPVTNAILAVHDPADAFDRSGPDDSNKAVHAVDAAVDLANGMRLLNDY
jgi:6,7-dimethyl-8-ribityllumazine synthase